MSSKLELKMDAEKPPPVPDEQNFISCISWVPRGFAKENPDRIRMDDEELKAMMEPERTEKKPKGDGGGQGAGKDEGDGAELDNHKSDAKPKDDEQDVIDKYGLNDYDDDDDNDVYNSLAGLSSFVSNNQDPYVTLKDEDESDDDDHILPTDNLALVGHVNGEMCTVEVNLYNEGEGNSFVHHDFLLPSLPLCVEWIGFDPTEENEKGNYAAIGYMSNLIDIWDVDLLEPLEPALQLGNKPMKKKKKKKKNTEAQQKLYGHSDAVLSMAWNKTQKHILASGSADFTIELWDLTEGKPGATVTAHTEKVQTLNWHQFEPHNLLSGACDQTARLFDCRNPNTCNKTWTLDGEVEKVLFNTFSPLNFFVCTDKGMLYSMDIRKELPMFTLSAHDDSITGLALSPKIPGCVVTSSMDKTVKIWDIQDGKPECVIEKNFKIGNIHCAEFCPDTALTVAVGGNKGSFKIWDSSKSAAVKSRFEGRFKEDDTESS